MSETPISKLFVSGSQAVNEQELYNLLSPYLTIDGDSREIIFSQSFQELTNLNKILILLAAVKAKAIHFKVEEKISPSEIIKMDIMPAGSVKGSLKTLSDSREIKSEKGTYYLPNYKIPQLVASLKIKN
jgi:hypothetical protein